MNIYPEILDALSDEELKEAVREFKVWDDNENGVCPPGVLRRLILNLVERGQLEDTAIGVCRYGIHLRAARKWAGV